MVSKAQDSNVADGGDKKPYEKPRIVYREALEASAAVCEPAPPAKGDLGLCPIGPLSS